VHALALPQHRVGHFHRAVGRLVAAGGVGAEVDRDSGMRRHGLASQAELRQRQRARDLSEIVIDENPAPVAGTFTIGPRSGVTSISTRVRVNSYSYVRLVAELSDGKLYGVKAFVKASGGCSAPAASNADASKSILGQMKFRSFHADAGGQPEAQFMMRHPQNSGLQMDQLTRLYIAPFFIENLKIWQGDDLVVAMDGGIAISENPNIRFNYKSNGAANFRAEALDTSKHLFKDEWVIEKSML